MREAVIVGAARTPVGKFGGSLRDIPAAQLGAIAIKEAIIRAGINSEDIDEVLLGCVLQGGLGQNVARQASIYAGIPQETPSMTLNKVCGSGLRAISLAAQIIKAGDADVIIAGGMENMSASSYAVPQERWGSRMGNVEMIDMMVNDGLFDVFNKYHMGITAENIAEQWGLTREQLDEFSVRSQNRAEEAAANGKFKDEIIPVEVPQRKGDPIIFDIDEHLSLGTTIGGVSRLRPAFKPDGVVTAANSSGINDGGAAVVVTSKEYAEKNGLTILGTIKSYASAGVDPAIMGIGPVPATRKALEKAGLTVDDLDLVEANEAFAAQSLAVASDLKLDPEITNVNGGAIAIGHPIGASGTRIFVSLIYEMLKRDSKYGLATLCIGGGQGTAIVVER